MCSETEHIERVAGETGNDNPRRDDMARLAPISRPKALRTMAADIAWKRVLRALDRAERAGEETGDWDAFRAIALPLADRYHSDDFCGERQVDAELSKWRALNA